MNSLLYYYNNVQKMAAYRQAKRMQRGAKLGENQSPTAATKLVSKGLPIGVDDFSIEFYGNSYGSAGYGYPTIFSNTKPVDWQTYAKSFGENGIQTVFYNSTVNKPEVKYTAPNESTRFHFVWTRENTTLRAYINGDLTGEVVDIPVKDLGDLQLAIANSSDVSFVRVWNYALSADEIATLYNNGDPMGYVVPKAKRDGLLAEYLPQNLMYSKDDKTIATSWLDSAKQMPLSDEYMEPLFQSIGGYDMAANGAPEILYNE